MGSPQEPAKRSAWGERRQELPRRLSGVVSTFVTSLPNAKVIDSDSFLTYFNREVYKNIISLCPVYKFYWLLSFRR